MFLTLSYLLNCGSPQRKVPFSGCGELARFLVKFRMVRPPRIELGLRVPETLVISLSLRAPTVFYHPL